MLYWNCSTQSLLQFDNDNPGNLTLQEVLDSDLYFPRTKMLVQVPTLQVQISQNGTGYNTADTFVITGDKLGGATPPNDVYLRVVSKTDLAELQT